MKKRFWQKSLSVCLALLMTAALFPAQLISVSAESGVPYIDRHWDDDMEAVQSEIRYCTSYSWLSGDEDEDLYSGWYVTESGSRFNSSERLYVYGTVNIILTDGVTLECLDGINVPSGSTLNIYGQIGDTGELKAIADTNCVAAIGGDKRQSNGTINIYGGKVTATADVDAAGIGVGGCDYKGDEIFHNSIFNGSITFNGGVVTCNTDEGKCVAIGMDESTLVEDSDGKVYFNGATVRMETTDATPSEQKKFTSTFTAVPILYDVICENTGYGTVTANPNQAAKDTQVTITAEPDANYVLSTIEAYKEYVYNRRVVFRNLSGSSGSR